MPLEYASHFLTLFLLLGALVIFTVLAARSRTIKSFQFQMSVFILIWVISEIIETFHEMGLVHLDGLHRYGLAIHLGSMIFLAVILWARFRYSVGSLKSMLHNERDAAIDKG